MNLQKYNTNIFGYLFTCVPIYYTAFICLLLLSPSANAQVTISIFLDSTVTDSFSIVRTVYVVDLDGDMDMDVLGASPTMNNSEIKWFENKGNEGFIEHSIPTSASGIQSIYAVDIDGDLDIDVLTASSFDRKITWFENDGNQMFTEHVITTSAQGASWVYAADINGDGHMDVLSSSNIDNKIRLYQNNGNSESPGFFTREVGSAHTPYSVFAADVNSDEHMDVLSASWNDKTIAWYEYDGGVGFTKHIISDSADGAHSVFAIDMDGDFDIDVLSASVNDDRVAWYENDGNEVFTTHIISDSADGARLVYAIDMDGDLDIDVLSASSYNKTIEWYENDGNEVFTTHIISDSTNGTYVINPADIDGDGKVDVVGASFASNTITWYKNESHSFVGSGTLENPFQISTPEDLQHVRFALSSPFLVTSDIDLDVAPYNTGEGWEPIGKNIPGNEFQGVFDGNGFTIKNLFINRPASDNVGLFGVNLGVIKNQALENVDITAARYTGALVGRNYSDVLNSYATGLLSAADFSGGLVGYNEDYLSSTAEIANSFSLVDVISSGSISGGLLGWLASGEVKTSYAAGAVSSSNGGLIWFNNSGTVTDSYWDTEATGQSSSSGGGTGLTTTQMQQSSNFTGFDFGTHWNSMDGVGYPHLQMFGYKKAAIHGNEGWRMFTSPSSALSYAELLEPFWTQGFTGSDSDDAALSNVLIWNESTQLWSIPTTASEKPDLGTGFIVYVFSDDNGPHEAGDAGFPKMHTHSHSQFTGTTTPTLSYTDTGNPSDNGWNLVGNPYGTSIDWDGANGWSRNNVDNTVYVWSDSASNGVGAYLTWNGITGTLGHGKISPWQGFWVKANAMGPSISFNDSVKSRGATFHKQSPVPQIQLHLEDGEKYSKSVIMFHELAKSGKDGLDAYKLSSLHPDYLLLGTSLPGGESMDIQALPAQPDDIDLELTITGSDLNKAFNLKWANQNIPEEWSIFLFDKDTEEEYEMSKSGSVSFSLKTKPRITQEKDSGTIPKSPVQVLQKIDNQHSRFVLRIRTTSGVSNDVDSTLPTVLDLKQNYPNPFNPSTTINFDIPEQATVRLEVFDLLGRKVSELLNEPKMAGRYSINFDARRLASGLYIYRLQAGAKVLTKKMTLIK